MFVSVVYISDLSDLPIFPNHLTFSKTCIFAQNCLKSDNSFKVCFTLNHNKHFYKNSTTLIGNYNLLQHHIALTEKKYNFSM